MIMSLKQRETKFILRIKVIDPQQGQPTDTYTQLNNMETFYFPLSVCINVRVCRAQNNFLDSGRTR